MVNLESFGELNLEIEYIAQLHGLVVNSSYSLSINTMSPHIDNFGLYVVALFKAILLEEQFFDLQSEIIHTDILYSFCLATRDEFKDSGY